MDHTVFALQLHHDLRQHRVLRLVVLYTDFIRPVHEIHRQWATAASLMANPAMLTECAT